MSEPPPPSAPVPPEPPFFHHPDGQRIHVFVEAGGIMQRPRQIRKLKKHHAVICTDPKHAQVILVDPESWQGREFIREWGKDQNKVVLNHKWISKSIDAGKPLLEGDDWGGFKTRDDGLPILRPTVNDNEGEPAPKSPPQTPQETPMGPKKVSPKRPRKDLVSHENHGTSSSASNIPANAPSSAQPPQPQSHSQSTPVLSPTSTDPGSVFAQQQQQAPSNMPFPLPNTLLPGYSPMNMMQFPPQMLAMFAQQQQQQAGAQSPILTQPPAMLPQMQENFTTALMDVMKMYGTMPGGMTMGQTGQWPMVPNMMAPIQQQMPQSVNGDAGVGTLAREGSSGATSSSRKATESPNLTMLHSPSVLEASIKRKRKSDIVEGDSADDLPGTENEEEKDEHEDEPPLAALYKKKKKDEERTLKHQRKEKDGRKARRSNMQFTVPARNPHGSQTIKPISSGDSSQKLFTHPNGKPMQFFVQVDQNNRQEVTRAIKKHGGTIVSQVPGADYAVLYTLSTTFKNLLNEAAVTKTPAVTHHFVLDAITQGSIPDDLDNYLFDAKPARRKRFSNAAEAEDRRLEKNAKQMAKAKEQVEKKYNYVARSGTPESQPPSVTASASSSASTLKKPAAPKPSGLKGNEQALLKGKAKEIKGPNLVSGLDKKPGGEISTPGSASTLASPVKKKKKKPDGYYPKETTPPPPTKAEKCGNGYLYTPEEKDWVERYLFIIFKRDPLASQTFISKLLYRQLPHHSQGSWGTFLTGAFKTQYEEMRKKGGIAHRKEKSRWEAEQLRAKEEQGNLKKSEQEKKEEGKPVPSGWNAEWASFNQDQKLREEEREKQEECAEEKEIEDQVMEELWVSEKRVVESKEGANGVSPMQVDGPTDRAAPNAMEDTEDAPEAKIYTVEEEQSMNTIVQFFLDGGDQGEEEDVIWQKLTLKVGRKTAAEWASFFSKHDTEITRRYERLLDQNGS